MYPVLTAGRYVTLGIVYICRLVNLYRVDEKECFEIAMQSFCEMATA